MIPDINQVRKRHMDMIAEEEARRDSRRIQFESIKDQVSNILYDAIETTINSVLESGQYAGFDETKLKVRSIHNCIKRRFDFHATDEECIEVLDDIFDRLKLNYSAAKYTTRVVKNINIFNNHYADFYYIEVTF